MISYTHAVTDLHYSTSVMHTTMSASIMIGHNTLLTYFIAVTERDHRCPDISCSLGCRLSRDQSGCQICQCEEPGIHID